MRKNYYLIICAVIIILGLYLRYLILRIPLSFDEGQWAYTATLLLKGQIISKDVFTTSPLFIFLPYVFSEFFLGHGLLNLRITGLLWNFSTGFLIYLTAKKLFSSKIGILSFVIFSVYSINFQQEGHFLFVAEQISQLPLFLSIYLLISFYKNQDNKKIFLSGLFIGLACNMREHYLLLALLLVIYFILMKVRKKIYKTPIVFFLAGFLSPFIFIFFYVLMFSDFNNYVNGVYIYKFSRMIGTLNFGSGSDLISIMLFRLKPDFFLISLSLVSLLTLNKRKNISIKLVIYIVLLVDIISLLSTGKRLFGHYFLYLTYGLIIPSALGFDYLLNKIFKKNNLVKFTFIILSFYIVFNQFKLNESYLLFFNLPIFDRNYAYKNLIINKEMIDYLNSFSKETRVIFLGESVSNYYYLNRDVKEKFPAADYFIDEVYSKNEFPSWFRDFKKNPAVYAVTDNGLKDVLVVPEFREFFLKNYTLDKKINQHYIFKFKNSKI